MDTGGQAEQQGRHGGRADRRETVLVGSAGLRLAADVWGDPSSPPVLLLHGGGQTRHAWGGTGAALAAAGWRAVAFDSRGHGDSDWADDGDYSIDAYVADLAVVAAAFDRPPVLVGASLGGLTSLIAAGEAACAAAAVVLVDCAPRLEEDGVAKILTFMRCGLDGFATLDEAADAIAAYRPHRERPRDLSGLHKNLRLRPDGRYRWHWDPRFVEGTRRPTPSKEPDRLLQATAALRAPTLLVRGRMSDVVSEAGAREFLAHAPHAEFVDVSDAGHMVAGDRNDAFTEAVVAFLQRVVPPTQGTVRVRRG